VPHLQGYQYIWVECPNCGTLIPAIVDQWAKTLCGVCKLGIIHSKDEKKEEGREEDRD